MASIWCELYLPWLSSTLAKSGRSTLREKYIKPAVKRCRGEKREREQRAVDNHQDERADQLNGGKERADAVMHREFAHLPCAVEPALNITGASAVEIRHRQRQNLSAEKIENRGVESDGGEREQIFLRQRRCLHENKRDAHPEQNCLQQADVFFDDDFVDDHVGENREEQLQEGDDEREQQHLQKDRAEFCEERQRTTSAPAFVSGVFSNAVV